ncbi:hypothetical protein GPJ56_000798 [Histomonas meleagridis]|uniref:uncharacterized protein n=1 Tax=Histomonas meleagridis TaxID=135588 RepID=UPI00355AA9B4|nr:hypothetical protein GPJ56_000798 [Histomonas meleagridis]KAH0804443.1 hypothetical protein GO595_003273 [Histomonas meleagridis]
MIQVPFKNVCDAVFKKEILPAVYRWIKAFQPEQLQRFDYVFTRLSKDSSGSDLPTSRTKTPTRLLSSRYTIPEWKSFPIEEKLVKKEKTVEDYLKRPTLSNLTYGAFDSEQMAAARAIPTRTRANDRSQINATERSEEYMAKWSERMMNTSYRTDLCSKEFDRTKNKFGDLTNTDNKILVYSKDTLNKAASQRAKKYADVDPAWTRAFREMCRSLDESINATAYRNNFTTIKKVNGKRFVHPKWTDPIPTVSRGPKRPAESFWETTNQTAFVKPQKTDETFKATDQHKACYSCPFDHHPLTEKYSTTFRSQFQDHLANKDEHPEYYRDMVVRMPSGSAVVGDVLGDGNIPK